MIVTVQIVFCFLKEAFQSLLFKYREGHSGDHVERLVEVTKAKGEQLKVPCNFRISSVSAPLCNSFFTILLLCLVQEIIQRGESL